MDNKKPSAVEAWVTLRGPDGRAIHTSPAIFARTESGGWVNDGEVTFGPLSDPNGGPMVHITQMHIVTDDGEERVIDL